MLARSTPLRLESVAYARISVRSPSLVMPRRGASDGEGPGRLRLLGAEVAPNPPPGFSRKNFLHTLVCPIMFLFEAVFWMDFQTLAARGNARWECGGFVDISDFFSVNFGAQFGPGVRTGSGRN